MARFDFDMPLDFMKSLGKLADVEKIAPQMIEEAMPILERNLSQVLQEHRDTGAMIGSVKIKKVAKNNKGIWYAIVRPTGEDSKGVRNMQKMAHIEYGTSKQNEEPFIGKVIKGSEAAVLAKMREVYKREAKK